MSTAEELREVATLVRETAAKALHGPWAADEDGTAIFSAAIAPHGAPCVVPQVAYEDGAWIALANPVLGEPLAALFDACAAEIDRGYSEAELIGYGGPGRYMNGAALVDQALAMARAIRPSVEQAARATSPGGAR